MLHEQLPLSSWVPSTYFSETCHSGNKAFEYLWATGGWTMGDEKRLLKLRKSVICLHPYEFTNYKCERYTTQL